MAKAGDLLGLQLESGSGTFPPCARSTADSPTVHWRRPAISTPHPQLMMTAVAPWRPLGHTVQRKPPARPAIAARARRIERHQKVVFVTSFQIFAPAPCLPPPPPAVCFAPPWALPCSCPLRHTRGFVTSISALPNCCTPANHSSVRPGTQRSLRDTHRALLGGFLVSRSICSASAIS
jgi:hypothetical protein